MSSSGLTTLATGSGAMRLDVIDGLRAVAALLVCVYHIGFPRDAIGAWNVETTYNAMTRGVDIFFVLSGFCIFWPYATDPAKLQRFSTKSFMQRRLWRIVPAYYANILFVTLLPIALVLFWRAIGQPAKWQPMPSWFDYTTHLLFIHTFFVSTWASIQGVYWTLALEMQFYLVFPLVIWLYKRIGLATLLLMLAACIAYRMGVSYAFRNYTGTWELPFLFRSTFIGCWVHFAAGMFAAWFVARRLQQDARPLGAAFATAIIVLGAGLLVWTTHTDHFTSVPLFPADDFVVAAGVMLVAIGVTLGQRSPLARALSWRPLVFIGVISYSLYLVHQNVAWYMSEMLIKVAGVQGWTRFAVMMIVGMPILIGLSWVSYRLFERPFMRRSLKRSTVESQSVQPDLVRAAHT